MSAAAVPSGLCATKIAIWDFEATTQQLLPLATSQTPVAVHSTMSLPCHPMHSQGYERIVQNKKKKERIVLQALESVTVLWLSAAATVAPGLCGVVSSFGDLEATQLSSRCCFLHPRLL